MSLHLGNLSSRIRKDELEHVFRRFGRCNVQLKDKFGFVVYDFPVNAEKALRTLRGKNICGEPITISWSNRQPRGPRPLQKFARGGRSYEPRRMRHSAREDYVNRKLGSNGRRDYKMGLKQPDGDGQRLSSAELVDETTNYHQDNIKGYIGEKHHDFRDNLPDEGEGVEKNLLDNDRWGEQVAGPSNENGVGNGLEFDRYEPYLGEDRMDEDENHHVAHSAGSPTLRKSQEKAGIEQVDAAAMNHPDNPKSQQTCYTCGEFGHKMRNCPQDDASRRKKLSRFGYRRDDEINFRGKGEGELKRIGSKSRGRLRPSRNAVLLRQLKSDRKASSSRKHRRLIRSGNSPVAKETHRARRKEYREKKRSRREHGSTERHHAKKARGPVSSPIHSDYTASRSRSLSKSFRSVSGSSSHSRSRSVSSRTHPLSSNSSSVSTSHNYRSISSKSRSSSPTSLSLSVSLGRPLPSSPNKVLINQDSLVNTASPESKVVLVEQGQLVEADVLSDNSKLENMTVAVENETDVAPFKVAGDMDKDHSQRMDGDNNRSMSRASCEVKNSCTTLSEKGDLAARSLFPQSSGELRELQNCDVLMAEHILAPTKNPESEVFLRAHTANSMSLSSDEMCNVLKHYGLEHPEENEKDLPVEAYFGSARLWPWEIIYYRRLRKGPISTENYAQRIAQNKEFGIVDKYVRSSSGWGELGQNNS